MQSLNQSYDYMEFQIPKSRLTVTCNFQFCVKKGMVLSREDLLFGLVNLYLMASNLPLTESLKNARERCE